MHMPIINLFQGYTLVSYTIASLLACDEVKKVVVVTSDQTKVGTLPSWWISRLRSEKGGGHLFGQFINSCVVSGRSEVPQQDSEDCSEGQTEGMRPLNASAEVVTNQECEIMPPALEHKVLYVAGSTTRHRSIKCGLDAMERLIRDGSGKQNACSSGHHSETHSLVIFAFPYMSCSFVQLYI